MFSCVANSRMVYGRAGNDNTTKACFCSTERKLVSGTKRRHKSNKQETKMGNDTALCVLGVRYKFGN